MPQDVVVIAGHAPAPLQEAAAISVAAAVVPGVQDCARQPVVLPKNWQRAVPAALLAVLLPAQRPFMPHVIGFATATHAVAGSGSATPAAIAVHVPTAPARRQDSQVPPQALLQQTPGLPSTR